MAPRLADQLCRRILPMTMVRDQRPIALGLLDCVEVLPLDILDQRNLCIRRFIIRPNQRGDGMHLRLLRRPPPPLARNNLEPVIYRAHQDRLQYPVPRNRLGELGQAILIEMLARLVRVGPDPRHRDRLHARRLPLGGRRIDQPRRIAKQGAQPASKPVLLRIAHAATASVWICNRAITSRASLIYASDPGHFRS